MEDLFGEPLPEPKPRRVAKPKAERKPSAKQLRLQAPPPRVIETIDDDESRALKALQESGILSPSSQKDCETAIRNHVPSETAIKMAEWRRRHG